MDRHDARTIAPSPASLRRARVLPPSCGLLLAVGLLSPSPGRAQPSGGPYGPVARTYEVPTDAAHVYYVAPDGDPEATGARMEDPTTIGAAIELRFATDQLSEGIEDDWSENDPCLDSTAMLQYTSGSTGRPRGVVITHENIAQNSEFIRRSFQHTRQSDDLYVWHFLANETRRFHPIHLRH